MGFSPHARPRQRNKPIISIWRPRQRLNPHPDDQIETSLRDESFLQRGLCPYCACYTPPHEVKVHILRQTNHGWSFRCPNHGVSGCATRTLALCFTKEKR